MKNTKKLLLPSIAILLCAIVSLTGVTYAWFQSANSAAVEQISANVQAADGLLISWDAKDWKSTLSFDESYKAQAGNTDTTADGWTYSPVSTVNSVSSGALTMYSATVVDNKITTAQTADTGFVKFDLYVNLDSAQKIWLSEVKVNGVKNEQATDNNFKQDTIGRAARIAFLNQGTSEEYVVNTITNLNEATTASIYEPNAKAHTTEGLNNQNTNIGKNNGADYTGEVVLPYKGIKAAITNGSVALGGENTSLETVTTVTADLSQSISSEPNDGIVFDLGKGYTKLTVYIWVEGQDADCLNNLANTNLTVSFKLNKAGAETT